MGSSSEQKSSGARERRRILPCSSAPLHPGTSAPRPLRTSAHLLVGICLAICMTRVSSLAQVSEDASSQIFLLLVLKHPLASTPMCTPTPAATRTPTPTATATAATAETPCPADDVAGSYDVQYSNVRHNCPFPIPDPSPAIIEVIQSRTDLTLRSGAGDATGTIDPQTGDFQVVASTTEPPCDYGCVATTTGAFSLGRNPMTVAGTGQLDLGSPFGGTLCTVTYDIEGTRTGCASATMPSATT